MNKIFYFLLVVPMVLLMSCSKERPSVEPTPYLGDVIPTITGCTTYSPFALIKEITQGDYIQNQMSINDDMSAMLRNIFDVESLKLIRHLDTTVAYDTNESPLMRMWQIESYVFTYPTVSSNGDPIVLSGRVTFPNGKYTQGNNVESLSIYCHHSIRKNMAPSSTISPATYRALFNSAVIEPDLEGYGVDIIHNVKGFCFDALGRQIMDCAQAALRVMYSHGVILSEEGYTTGWGISLGCPAILSAARYYDESFSTEKKDLFHFRSLYGGSGPLLLDSLLCYFNSHPDYPAVVLLTLHKQLYGVDVNKLGGYEPGDFCPYWMDTTMCIIDGKQYSYLYAMQHNLRMNQSNPIPFDMTKMTSLLNEDMLTSDGRLDNNSPKTQAFRNYLRSISDWGWWMPSMKVYLTHGLADTQIPYTQAHSFAMSKMVSDNVSFKGIHVLPLSALNMDNHSVSTLLSTILMLRNEDPADAYRNN